MAGNSQGAKKGAQTKKEKYGADYHSRIGRMGARLGTRGYFGKLKDENPEELKRISKEAAEKSKRVRASKAEVRGPSAPASEGSSESKNAGPTGVSER